MAGGLGGMGGWGSTIQALGMALLASPRGAPFSALPEIMSSLNSQEQQNAKRLDAEKSRQVMGQALEKMGIDPAFAYNTEAANLLLQQQNRQKALEQIPRLNEAIERGFGTGTPPGGTLGPRSEAPAAGNQAMAGSLAPLTGLRAAASRGYGGAPSVRPFRADPELATAIAGSAQRLGIDPVDLGTVISYETGGRFSPSIRGGTGNRHIGLIQFGPNEQRRYGASQGQSVPEQMAAVERYLVDRKLKPGMGIMDIYSTINAGRPGRFGASDAANGGAPGTVADKVNFQMAGHRAKAQALLASLQGGGVGGETVAGGVPLPPRRPIGIGGETEPDYEAPRQPVAAAPAATVQRRGRGYGPNGEPVSPLLGETADATQPDPRAAGQVAGGGGKIGLPAPTPAQLQSVIQTPPKPLAEYKYNPQTNTMQTLAKKRLQLGLQLSTTAATMGDLGKPYADLGHMFLRESFDLLKKTDREKEIANAFPGDEATQRHYLQLPFTLPEKQFEASRADRAQDTQFKERAYVTEQAQRARDEERKNIDFAYRQSHDTRVLQERRESSRLTAEQNTAEWRARNPEVARQNDEAEIAKTRAKREAVAGVEKETPLPGELAGRVGLAESFLRKAPELRDRIKKGDLTGILDNPQAQLGVGEKGTLYGDLESGADALQRGLTGAGMNKDEAKSYARRYLPTKWDTATTAGHKFEKLVDELLTIRSKVYEGRKDPGLDFDPRAPAAPKLSAADVAQSLANARTALSANPGARDAILARLRAAGIDPGGL